jgi:NSS family neurotransmitter:Na+ symporter
MLDVRNGQGGPTVPAPVKPRLRRAALRPHGTASRGSHRHWSSARTLTLAACGAAIGFNNFWQFPAVVVKYGGGAFLIVYALCVVVIGLPLLAAELLLGQRGQASPIGTFRYLASEAHASRAWSLVGWASVVSGFLIFSYLSVVAGWTLAYLVRAILGVFAGQTADGINSIFNALVSDPEKQLFWHTLFVLTTLIVAARGVRSGIEPMVRIAVPVMAGLLGILLVYSATTDAFPRAIEQLLMPDFARLGVNGLLAALGHAFFSLSLGVGVMMMYGAYAQGEVKIVPVALWVAVVDTAVGVVAAIVVLSVLYSGSIDIASGPALIFQALPLAFDQAPFGQGFVSLFFALLAVVAWLAAIALIEPALAWLTERFVITRIRAVFVVGGAAWVVGLVMMLSLNYWSFSFRFLGEVKKLGLFDVAQILTAQVLLPLCGVFVAVFAGWRLKPEVTRAALNMRSPCAYDAWLWLVRVAIPLLLLVLFFHITELFA